MSRAFVKEDVEIAERSGHRRSVSGLPPGALNLMTEDGAQRLRGRLAELKSAEVRTEEMGLLEHILASATVVPSQANPKAVVFGAEVTLKSTTGELATYRIVGADEVHLEPHYLSWVSAIGRALLGAAPGQRLRLSDGTSTWWTVVSVREAAGVS